MPIFATQLRIRLALLALVVAVMPAMALAQRTSERAPELFMDRAAVWRAGAGQTMYRFVALAGTTIRVRVSGGRGKSILVLYTPAGDEMLSAEGVGSVSLEAILPLNDEYFVGVIRADSTAPRTLRLSRIEADPLKVGFAEYVGYERVNTKTGEPVSRQCWVEPGAKLRVLPLPGTEARFTRTEITLSRDGTEYFAFFRPDGSVLRSAFQARYVGDSVITRSWAEGGTPRERRALAPSDSVLLARDMRSRTGLGRYAGYHCAAIAEEPPLDPEAADLSGNWQIVDAPSAHIGGTLVRIRQMGDSLDGESLDRAKDSSGDPQLTMHFWAWRGIGNSRAMIFDQNGIANYLFDQSCIDLGPGVSWVQARVSYDKVLRTLTLVTDNQMSGCGSGYKVAGTRTYTLKRLQP